MFGGVTQRASSVPTSPVRRSSEVAAEDPPSHEDPRRRSFDHAGAEADEARDVVKEMASAGLQSAALSSAIEEHEEDAAEEITHAEAAEAEAEGSGNGADEKAKEKRDDAWGKIARRISVSMKLGGTRDKDREKDKDKDSRPGSRQGERGRKTEKKDALRAMRSPRTGSLAPSATTHDAGSDAGDASDPGRPRASSPVPPSPRISSPLAGENRPSGSRRSSANPFSHHHHHHRRKEDAKAYATPRMSDDDMAYIRRVLADVHPVTGNPLSILQNAFSTGSSSSGVAGTTTLATQALWAKLGHLPGIEECLRMFTAVEILDGENMVGCHRCWKIANGLYKPRTREDGVVAGLDDDTDSETESESENDSSDKSASGKSDAGAMKSSTSGTHPVVPGLNDMDDGAPQSSPDLSSGRVSPASTSIVSTQITHSSSTTSISSAPTTVASVSPPKVPLHARKDSVIPPETYGGLPIPKISTTEPETPSSAPIGRTYSVDQRPSTDALTRTWSTPGAISVSTSNDSLLTPRARHHGRSKGTRKDGAEDSGESSDDEFDSESDTSATTSARSDGSVSPSVSPSASPNSSVEKLTGVSPLGSPRPHDRAAPGAAAAVRTKIPRAKQVVMRKMYKRYLISTPPPVLVIHLKRFQQMAKVHTISLSGGFKKLDDFVAFPEMLDLAPFLAPRREDFAHDRAEKEKGKERQERCMYRLYAVIVHMGNMVRRPGTIIVKLANFLLPIHSLAATTSHTPRSRRVPLLHRRRPPPPRLPPTPKSRRHPRCLPTNPARASRPNLRASSVNGRTSATLSCASRPWKRSSRRKRTSACTSASKPTRTLGLHPSSSSPPAISHTPLRPPLHRSSYTGPMLCSPFLWVYIDHIHRIAYICLHTLDILTYRAASHAVLAGTTYGPSHSGHTLTVHVLYT